MHLEPMGDRVIAETIPEDEVLPSGIVIPDIAQEKTQRARVVAVGPGTRRDDGGYNSLAVEEGDLIVHARYTGQELTLDGQDLLVLNGSDIIAKIAE